jgi:mRNA-degrading endonuclease RelE of RelBE toxin-antitoxin system
VFSIVIEKKAEKFIKELPQKTRRIIVDKILELPDDPFPGGNKEKLEYDHRPSVYRLHVSRSFTVFYIIEKDEHLIKIVKITTIERAHKDYSRG